MDRRGRLILVAAALLALTGCTPGGTGSRTTSTRSSSSACPAMYASPDPNRPRMQAGYTLSADHTTVRGSEQITFRPDLPITELVFRLTANSPSSVSQGNRIVIDSAAATPGGGRFGFTAAAAPSTTQGGLLRIPFGRTIPAGTVTTARIGFTLTLGTNAFERFGRAGGFAYFGSGEPLLAWERGVGWHTENLLDFLAESATSEAMDVHLRVEAPSADVVIASGDPVASTLTKTGTRVWTSHLGAARDVSVAAGPFAMSDSSVNGVRLRIGARDASERDALVPKFRRAIVELAARYGPFPFPSLSVARLPGTGGGIEYPSSILMLDSSTAVAVHETAHQYFYAMIGNSQARDPWLDEAFAQYSEELVDGVASHPADLAGVPGPVGGSTTSFRSDGNGYYRAIYYEGSTALAAARSTVGPAQWDATLRCYVARNAWRVVRPSDFRAAIAAYPQAIAILDRAGAF